MEKPISPGLHGVLDYSTMAMALAAPRLLGFPRSAAILTYALAGGYVAMSAFTDYPAALKRALPLQAHRWTDIALGALLPSLPLIVGYRNNSRVRNFFLALSGINAAVTAMTNWEPQRTARTHAAA